MKTAFWLAGVTALALARFSSPNRRIGTRTTVALSSYSARRKPRIACPTSRNTASTVFNITALLAFCAPLWNPPL